MPILQSLKFRLLVIGLVLIMLGLVMRLSVGLPFAQDLLRDLVAAQQLSTATYVAEDIDHSIRERRALLAELGATLPTALLQQPEQLTAWLQQRQRLNPLFNKGLALLRADGNGVMAEYPTVPGREKLIYTHADWFQAALQASVPVMSKPRRGRASGEPVLMMALAVRDAEQRVVAVLTGVVALNAPGFLDRLQKIPFGTSGGFLLISPADQLFVAASDPAMVLQPTPAAGVNLLHDRAMGGYRGTGTTVNARGVEELSAMVTVPSTGWFVVVRMPAAEAFRPIDVLRGLVIKGTVATILVLLALMLLLAPYMLRPLTSAARAMREMADGKRELAPLPVTLQDEVGDLVLGFNYLVTRLQEKESALRASEARLGHLAHHDVLTGLYNRAMLADRLQQALLRAERESTHFALLFCDLDDFKPINDQFGHGTGDAILRQAAARLLADRRRTDTVARFGGDEFVILLTDLQDARDMAASTARQLLAALSVPFQIEDQTFTLGASIGIALYEGAPLSVSQLMSQADIAMYQAKRAGKNGFRLFDPADQSLGQDRYASETVE